MSNTAPSRADPLLVFPLGHHKKPYSPTHPRKFHRRYLSHQHDQLPKLEWKYPKFINSNCPEANELMRPAWAANWLIYSQISYAPWRHRLCEAKNRPHVWKMRHKPGYVCMYVWWLLTLTVPSYWVKWPIVLYFLLVMGHKLGICKTFFMCGLITMYQVATSAVLARPEQAD